MIIRNFIGKVYLACGATDFRKSISGLALLVQYSFDLDPFSNCLFVFCNRNKDKLKILQWEHDGFWLHYKRLEKGKFKGLTMLKAKPRELQNESLDGCLADCPLTSQKQEKRSLKE